ncbi:MAG TPA: Nramp family divalent metal transporter, partial [Anaerolineae bacterium]|nr:Nramp family divalent metal transporter [Anaerolineae bacterium]
METKDLPVKSMQIGVSRPELPLDDLPLPEKVFEVKKIGLKELLVLVLGPSMIALGVSIGSGEWLLGPMAVAKYGFIGIGWIMLTSAILQTFYNVELARYTIATGEVPIVGFTRTPPGKYFWISFTLLIIYVAWIWGGWAATAGQSLFTLFTGRPHSPEELEIVRLIGIALMIVALGLFLFGKRISRTMEVFSTVMVFFILFALITLAVIVVPLSFWVHACRGLVTVTRPPEGIDVSLLGALAGYTGFASGMNFMIINYYRDKGYGMGHKVGFIAGLVGGRQQEMLASGVTFRESAQNTHTWKRWFRFLVIDQWVVFFTGAIIGMIVPCILVGYLASMPGARTPDMNNMPIYAATELGRLYGSSLFYICLLVGALTLFKTQSTILEMLIRNTTDASFAMSERFRQFLKGDPRRFYYPFAIVLVIVIGIII